MKIKVSNILLSLIMTLTIISLAVVLTLACKPLYYLDIRSIFRKLPAARFRRLKRIIMQSSITA